MYPVLVFTKANYEDCSPTPKNLHRSLDIRITGFRDFPLVVQWLRLYTSNVGAVGLIPGQGTRILHALQAKRKIARFKI